MQLKQGEGELQSGKAIIKEFSVGDRSLKEKLLDDKGMLYLTNRRLAMEKETSPEKSDLIFELPLEALQNAEAKGVFGKILTIEADLSKMSSGVGKDLGIKEGFGKFSIKVEDPKTWAAQLNKAIKSRKEER